MSRTSVAPRRAGLYYEEPARFNEELLEFVKMAAAEGAERGDDS